jgi:hypothetical protein
LVVFYDNAKIGDPVSLDNSWYLALQTFHRHNVPTPDMYGWNQFREGGDGDPIYPQRETLVGPIGAVNASGALNTGNFKGKMIVLESMVDIEGSMAGGLVRHEGGAALGKQGIEDNYRLATPTTPSTASAGPPAHADGRYAAFCSKRPRRRRAEQGTAAGERELRDRRRQVVVPRRREPERHSVRRRADRRRWRPCGTGRRSAGQFAAVGTPPEPATSWMRNGTSRAWASTRCAPTSRRSGRQCDSA